MSFVDFNTDNVEHWQRLAATAKATAAMDELKRQCLYVLTQQRGSLCVAPKRLCHGFARLSAVCAHLRGMLPAQPNVVYIEFVSSPYRCSHKWTHNQVILVSRGAVWFHSVVSGPILRHPH